MKRLVMLAAAIVVLGGGTARAQGLIEATAAMGINNTLATTSASPALAARDTAMRNLPKQAGPSAEDVAAATGEGPGAGRPSGGTRAPSTPHGGGGGKSEWAAGGSGSSGSNGKSGWCTASSKGSGSGGKSGWASAGGGHKSSGKSGWGSSSGGKSGWARPGGNGSKRRG